MSNGRWFSLVATIVCVPSILLCVACRLLDGEGKSEERGLEAFWGVCIELFEQRLERT